MSWCLMQEKVTSLESDVDIIYGRTGGRAVDMEPKHLATTSDVQVVSACQWIVVVVVVIINNNNNNNYYYNN